MFCVSEIVLFQFYFRCNHCLTFRWSDASGEMTPLMKKGTNLGLCFRDWVGRLAPKNLVCPDAHERQSYHHANF